MLLLALAASIAAFLAKPKFLISCILLLIPFQFVSHRLATSTVLFAYIVLFLLAFQTRLRFPLLWVAAIFVATYLISLAFAERFHSLHAIYLLNLFSAFAIFYLSYNYAKSMVGAEDLFNLLLVLNLGVTIYCLLQLTAGEGKAFIPFGIDALAFNGNRVGDTRLTGPFANAGTTATFFVFATLIAVSALQFKAGWQRAGVYLLLTTNVGLLTATANRSAFLLLVVALPVLIYLNRKSLGVARSLTLAGVIALLVVVSSIITVSVTEFDRMFARMLEITATEGGLPVTRAEVWSAALDKIGSSPIVGQGPLFISPEMAENLGLLRTAFDVYPHSLYLHQLRTIGALGLAGTLLFFMSIAFRLKEVHSLLATRRWVPDIDIQLLRCLLLIAFLFFADQLRLEYSRLETIDFAQYIFMIYGIGLGVAERLIHADDRRTIP